MGGEDENIAVTRCFGPQKGPQADLLSCPANEIMFGGARGGGKTAGIVLDWLAHQSRNGGAARGVMFRRTYKELENVIEETKQMYVPYGAKFKASDPMWVFPNGSTLKMRHLDRDEDASEYQGHQYSAMYFDEAGRWPSPTPINNLRACVRSTAGIRPRMVLTSNPGGRGHGWLKRRFVDPVPPLTVQYEESTAGIPWSYVFIPSRIEDNRILMRVQPGYIDQIRQSGPPALVKAWLEGDWNIVLGGAVDDLWEKEKGAHIIQPFVIPTEWRVDRSFDYGSSAPFSVLWWAESNGEEFQLPCGETSWVPSQTLFLFAEWYGANDLGEGLRATNAYIAEGIRKREASMTCAGRVRPGPADSSIYDVMNGTSIADEMEVAGVCWERADKRPGSRINGLQLFRGRLQASLDEPMEQPGFYVFETCRHFIQHIPMLQLDASNPEDVDKRVGDDHDWDATRYRILAEHRSIQARKVVGMF